MKEKFIAQTVSDTNLYTKNLLRSVTFEQLRLAYSKFGEITHMRIVTPKNPAIKTNFGYINYGKAPSEDLNEQSSKNETETDPKICAKNALIHARSDLDIRRLYENEQHFLTIFVPADPFLHFFLFVIFVLVSEGVLLTRFLHIGYVGRVA